MPWAGYVPRSLPTATDALLLTLIAGLAAALAEQMVAEFAPENWQDSPTVMVVQDAAILLERAGQDAPTALHEAPSRAATAREPDERFSRA